MQLELLNVHDVAKLLNYKCRATVYNLMNTAGFPRPVRIGSRTVRWVRADVDAWVTERQQPNRVGALND